jgi:3-hydroxyisobutyrate dehydrogenase-like beta-hydroxyacid dehydrogenase
MNPLSSSSADGGSTRTRAAVLGTGRMGSAIARRLVESGLELVLWNRTRSRAEGVGSGIVVATPADAVARADVVITSLTGPDALRATLGGPSGALAAARGQSFVEMSTVGPDVLEELRPLVARTASTLVDAPLIGAPPAVLHGGALVIAGGERADVERVRPVLERLGELRHVGSFGSGARLKLVANSFLGALVLTAAELETAGADAGVDPSAVFDVLTRFVPSLAIRRAGFLEERHEPTLFALRDLRKDLDLALGVFHRVDAHVPITALVREWVDEAAAEDPHLDISAVALRYARSPGNGALADPDENEVHNFRRSS